MASRRQDSPNLPAGLDALPYGWVYKPLFSLVDVERRISYGIVQPGKTDSSGVPIVRVNNIKQGVISVDDILRISPEVESKYSRTRLQGGEVLLTLVGTLGECAIVPEELKGWNVARAVAVIPVLPNVSARWIAICLRSRVIQHYMNTWATTTVQATLNLRDVANLPIPLPPRKERDEIAHILGTLDDKIELNRRMNETLEAMARALFKSWFVDFDPVRAKAEKRQPVGMDAETAALFPSSFEDSPLGFIPKGWRVSTLANLIEINSWTLSKRDELERIQYIEISEVVRGDVLNVQEFERGQEPGRARRRLRHGDTVISTVRPDRGSHFLCLNPSPHLIASTGFAVLTPTRAPWSFVYAAATQREVFLYLGRLADGGAYPAVSPEAIGRWEIAIPCESQIIETCHELLAPLFQLSAANRVNSHTLAALRDALLPKLLSGEIRVREAEREVEQVV